MIPLGDLGRARSGGSMTKITEEDFSIDEIVKKAKRRDIGAFVIYSGVVRDDRTKELDIGPADETAVEKLNEIREEAVKKFDIKSLDVVHRVGNLSVGENILLVVCGAAHRRDAFDACKFVIDEIKKKTPIHMEEIHEDAK